MLPAFRGDCRAIRTSRASDRVGASSSCGGIKGGLMRHASLAALAMTAMFSISAEAAVFQLAGNAAVEAVDEAPSFSLTVGGITATLTANIGVLNTTNVSGFGVNAPGSLDESSQIDNDQGLE